MNKLYCVFRLRHPRHITYSSSSWRYRDFTLTFVRSGEQKYSREKYNQTQAQRWLIVYFFFFFLQLIRSRSYIEISYRRRSCRSRLDRNMAVHFAREINVSFRSLTRYCLQCLLCLTVQRFFFFEAPVVKPFPGFSLWGVDRFPLFAGIAVIFWSAGIGSFHLSTATVENRDPPFGPPTKVIDIARNFSLPLYVPGTRER